jgi:hypothetical protein
MRAGSARTAPTSADIDRIAGWVGGACGAAAAGLGFFVGFVYTLDQGDPDFALLYGVIGLVIGALLGLLNAFAPVVVLVAVDGQRWAAARPLRALLAAVAAAAPLGVVNLLLTAEPNAIWTVGCAAVTGLPAAVATVGLDRRTAALARGARLRAAAG